MNYSKLLCITFMMATQLFAAPPPEKGSSTGTMYCKRTSRDPMADSLGSAILECRRDLLKRFANSGLKCVNPTFSPSYDETHAAMEKCLNSWWRDDCHDAAKGIGCSIKEVWAITTGTECAVTTCACSVTCESVEKLPPAAPATSPTPRTNTKINNIRSYYIDQ